VNKIRNDRHVCIKNIRQIPTKVPLKDPQERLMGGCYVLVGEQCAILVTEIETTF